MRILVVNKFGFLRGGLERVMFDEMEGLRALGHEVELFATAHPDNQPLRFAADFPPYHEIGVSGSGGVRVVRDMFSNTVAATGLTRVIEVFRPDVIHCHGIHRHLSPSVLAAAHRKGVPTVLTAHDCFLVCPGNTLLRGGEVACLPRRCGRVFYGPAVSNRCVQGSVVRSALAAVELGYQRARTAYESGIDRLVTPSAFLRDLLGESGIDRARISVVPNAVPLPNDVTSEVGEGFLFAGRLSPEKGIGYAVEAARRAGVALAVAGDGPQRPALERESGVELLGMLDADEMAARMNAARAVVVPSVWPENFPMVVLEAMAAGKAVIASRIGGIPEQIDDGVSGLLVPAADSEALASAMTRLANDPDLARRLGAAARERVMTEFRPERHLELLMAAYGEAGAHG